MTADGEFGATVVVQHNLADVWNLYVGFSESVAKVNEEVGTEGLDAATVGGRRVECVAATHEEVSRGAGRETSGSIGS